MECVASRMRGSVECGPVTAHPLATASATKRGALLRATAASLASLGAAAKGLSRAMQSPFGSACVVPSRTMAERAPLNLTEPAFNPGGQEEGGKERSSGTSLMIRRATSRLERSST